MDIEAVIAEATKVAPAAEATEVAVEAEAPKEEAQDDDASSKADSELTPEQLAKREANRESHRNSREAKLRRHTRELQAKIANYEAKLVVPSAPPKSDELLEPTESDYNSWLDYTNALRKFDQEVLKREFQQQLSEIKQKSTEPKTEAPAVDTRINQRINEAAAKEDEFIKAVPEYSVLYQRHADFFDSLPKELAEALIEADDAPLALYALMKEDKLYDLEGLPATRLGLEIGRAEERGKAYLNTNKTTNAPPPIGTLKGTGTSNSLANKSVQELMKLYNQ